jgi:hypothetical protein
MIKVYYHVYAIENVESIVEEQLSLLQRIKQPMELKIGLSVCRPDFNYQPLLSVINPHIIGYEDNEFLTLNLILNDRIEDEDFVFYLHTKGASKMHTPLYEVESHWRGLMNRNLITSYQWAIAKLKHHNTCGFLLEELEGGRDIYSGNFWWATGAYVKTIDITGVDTKDRYNAELNFIQRGKNWNPYYITRKLFSRKKMTLI